MDKSCCNIKNIPQTISKTTNMELAVLHYHALKECLLYTGNMSLHRYRGGLKAHPRPPSHSWRIPELLERGACSTQPLEPDVMNAEVIPGAWGRQSSLGWVQKVTDYCLPIFRHQCPLLQRNSVSQMFQDKPRNQLCLGWEGWKEQGREAYTGVSHRS